MTKEEMCKRCGDGPEDLRTIRMACFYDMGELGLPLDLDQEGKSYCMRVCKACRGDWLAAIRTWFHAASEREASPGSGIFVRELGATREISEDEWLRRNPGREPVRFKANLEP